MTVDSLREVLSDLTRQLNAADTLLKKVRRPLSDVEAATALVGLLKVKDTAGKVLGRLKIEAEMASQPQLFDDQDNDVGGKGKKK